MTALQLLTEIESQIAELRAFAQEGSDIEAAFKRYEQSWLFTEARNSLYRVIREINEEVERKREAALLAEEDEENVE